MKVGVGVLGFNIGGLGDLSCSVSEGACGVERFVKRCRYFFVREESSKVVCFVASFGSSSN